VMTDEGDELMDACELCDGDRTNSSGGVVLASQDGKIVCDNTLDARLSVSFRQKLPEVRRLWLFPPYRFPTTTALIRLVMSMTTSSLQIRKKLFSQRVSS
jgi:hypothetical protein